MGKDNSTRTLHIVDVATGAIQEIPGSTGLFSPRWSPDGRYIAALTLDQRQVRLYTVATHTWTTLAVPSGADPIWSPDSHYLFIHASLDPAQPIDRISIPDGHVDEIVRLADSREHDAVDYVFGGLTQDQRPPHPRPHLHRQRLLPRPEVALPNGHITFTRRSRAVARRCG